MRIYDIIERKKKGLALTKNQIEYFVKGAVSGEIYDYQTSALLMAIVIKSMTDKETYYLTQAMIKSGKINSRGEITGIICDKHSTGGVSDSTTLIVVPILAAAKLTVAKLSGRGLGFTGGTLDKLESFDGFNVNLTQEEFVGAVKKTGAAIAGQTQNTVPADKKLYAIRDATATVDSIPLIASSIMSKKLATFADVIMLDVKYGSGAFMKSKKDALKLAQLMVKVGKLAGRKTAAIVTDMNQPLGNNIGCELEVSECIEILRSDTVNSSLKTVSLELAARTISLAKNIDYKDALEQSLEILRSKKAYEKLKEIVKTQNGSFDRFVNYSNKNEVFPVKSTKNGIFVWENVENIGKAAQVLGGGRSFIDEQIDHSVGIIIKKRNGDKVTTGDIVAEIYHNHGKGLKMARDLINKSYKIESNLEIKKTAIEYIV